MELDPERFARIAAALPGVLFELERTPSGDLRISYVNEGTRELFGIEPDELGTDLQVVLAAVHPDDRQVLLDALEESALEGIRLDWTGRAFSADGSLKHVQVAASVMALPGGGVLWSGTVLDQTEARWENALEAAMRRRLQLIVEHLPASSVALYDRNLRLCFCEGELFADTDLGAMMGRPLPQLVDPETFALLARGIETVLQGRVAAPVVLDRDSQGRSLSVNFASYRLADGRIDGAILHWQDISELRAAERGRAEAEELLQRGFDDAPIGMALLTPDGRWLRVNPALTETVGYTAEELASLSFAELTHPEDRSSTRRLVGTVLRGEAHTRQFEKRFVRADGTIVWVRLTVSLASDGAGEPLYLVAQIEDITERRRSEQELAQAREEIDRFFALSPELMAIANGDGEWVRVNPAFETTLGYAPAELLGQSLVELIHPEDVEDTMGVLRDQVRGDAPLQFENRCRTKDGRYRWLQWSGTTLRDGLAYAVGRDVTERREMEAQLRDSREQALSASRLKSEFVANMSHEIRTPLNGVLSMADLLLGTALDDEQREYAHVTATSAHALMRVIDDILDFSKIEAGKLEIVHDDYELAAVVDEVCEIVGPKAREKRIGLSHEVDTRVPPVLRGDGGRVRQVLMNLVGNAVKFTSQGRVAVRVARPAAADRVRIEVADTGIGIDALKLETLFQPFSQADATTTRRYGGTGLGLSIARQLVELMDGEIGVSSVPGSGSTFWFELPCERGAASSPESAPRDLTGIRVLIVDGDGETRIALEQQTARWGMIPESADSARLALAGLGRAVDAGRPFELAIISSRPASDGALADIAELMRELERSPRLRSTRCVLVGADGLGPVGADGLYDALGRALARSAEEATARRPVSRALAPTNGARVLVAEDNEINQFVALRILQKLGYAVELADNGREAIDMSAATAYAAIFMDCQMPEVDGYLATAAIRDREADRARTPIIAMTANTMAGDRERCLAAGMDDYLPKPLRLDQVAEKCRVHITRAVLATPAPAGRALDAAPREEAPSPFDPAALAAIGAPAQTAHVLELFLGQLDETVPAIAVAVDAGDVATVRSLAHRLKGGASTVGAPAVAAACAEIGAALRAGDEDPAGEPPAVREFAWRLVGTARLTAAAIRDHLGGLPAAA